MLTQTNFNLSSHPSRNCTTCLGEGHHLGLQGPGGLPSLLADSLDVLETPSNHRRVVPTMCGDVESPNAATPDAQTAIELPAATDLPAFWPHTSV